MLLTMIMPLLKNGYTFHAPLKPGVFGTERIGVEKRDFLPD